MMNTERGAVAALVAIVALLALLALLALIGAAGIACEPAASTRARPPVPVTVAVAVAAAVPIELEAVGTVVPQATVDVAARVGGEVRAIHFQEGAMVTKGELLFELDPAPYAAALAEALAVLARDTAQAENAEAEAERYRLLLEKRLTAASEGEAKIAEAKAMRATLGADEARVATARLELSWTKVTAPITGRADARLVSVGSVIAAGTDVVVTLRQTAPIQVSFGLPQEDLHDVQDLMKRRALEVTASLPDDERDRGETGTLTFVGGSVDTRTGQIPCKADFDNANERLWPGAFVRVLVKLGTIQNAVVIPSAAVQPGQQGSLVFVIGDDGRAQLRTVATAPERRGLVMVESGIEAGERVVIDGQMALVPGAKVELKPRVEAREEARAPSTPREEPVGTGR